MSTKIHFTPYDSFRTFGFQGNEASSPCSSKRCPGHNLTPPPMSTCTSYSHNSNSPNSHLHSKLAEETNIISFKVAISQTHKPQIEPHNHRSPAALSGRTHKIHLAGNCNQIKIHGTYSSRSTFSSFPS